MEKYELLKDDTITFRGKTLHRIRALKDFELITGDVVHCGDLGGYIENYDNLSQNGGAWASETTKILDRARVAQNAALISSACVYENAHVIGNAKIRGHAFICESDIDYIKDFYDTIGNPDINIYGDAEILDNATIEGYVQIHGEARVREDAYIKDSIELCGKVHVCGDSYLSGYYKLDGDLYISSMYSEELFPKYHMDVIKGEIRNYKQKVLMQEKDFEKNLSKASDLIIDVLNQATANEQKDLEQKARKANALILNMLRKICWD